MEVSVFESLFTAFDNQEHNYGLLFGYVIPQQLEKSVHLTSCLAPTSFQTFSCEKNSEQIESLLDFLEDFHTSVSGLRLLGIIAKHQELTNQLEEPITQQALIMKAQECFTGLTNRQFKSPFYFVYLQNSKPNLFEKIQGEVFKSKTFKEIKKSEVSVVSTIARLKQSRSFNSKQADDTKLPDFITSEAQKYLGSLETNSHILINSVIISNPKRLLAEIAPSSHVDFEFLYDSHDSTNSLDLQREATQIFFEEACINLTVTVSKSITISELKSVLIGGIQKELESRIYQIFVDPQLPKVIRDLDRSIQMPIKFTSDSFENMHILAYVSHKSLKNYGSCIYPSKEAAINHWKQEFPKKVDLVFKQSDEFAIDLSAATDNADSEQKQNNRTSDSNQNKQQKQGQTIAGSASQQEKSVADNQSKAKISYFVFSLAIAIMAYVFMKI